MMMIDVTYRKLNIERKWGVKLVFRRKGRMKMPFLMFFNWMKKLANGVKYHRLLASAFCILKYAMLKTNVNKNEKCMKYVLPWINHYVHATGIYIWMNYTFQWELIILTSTPVFLHFLLFFFLSAMLIC